MIRNFQVQIGDIISHESGEGHSGYVQCWRDKRKRKTSRKNAIEYNGYIEIDCFNCNNTVLIPITQYIQYLYPEMLDANKEKPDLKEE